MPLCMVHIRVWWRGARAGTAPCTASTAWRSVRSCACLQRGCQTRVSRPAAEGPLGKATACLTQHSACVQRGRRALTGARGVGSRLRQLLLGVRQACGARGPAQLVQQPVIAATQGRERTEDLLGQGAPAPWPSGPRKMMPWMR